MKESEQKKKKLASKMVGNETHRPFSGRLEGTHNLESLRKHKTHTRFGK